MANTVDKVLAIAAEEVGYLEKSATAYKKDKGILDKKTEGAGKNNYTKYGRDMHNLYPAVMNFPAAWCDCFVDWCFQKAYGVSNAKKLIAGNFDDYTPYSANLYKQKNAWHKTPKIGDQIFFTNGTRICHTGLVYAVDDNRVYTIEGNTSSTPGTVANGGAVAKKSYALSYSGIAGYGRPKYDTTETEENEIETQDVNAYAVRITATALNVRKGPGTNYGIVTTAKKGEVCTVVGEAKNGSTTWGKLSNGKGYISLKYAEMLTSGYDVKITASVLNVRKGPGTSYGIATTVRKNEVYTIVDEVKNGNTVWGKLKSGAGYISLAYTKRV